MAGFNRNRKKKTYSFNRSQTSKIISTSFDGKTEFFDETLVIVQNPFFILGTQVSQGVLSPTPFIYGEYDESIINFSWEESKSAPFNITFSASPIVTLEVLPAGGLENIVAFLGNVDGTSLTVNLSAPHSGQIVYRAIYAPSYPAIVSRSVVSTSYFYTASAGYTDLAAQDNFISNYSLLNTGSYPANVFVTTRDINNNGDADVAIVDSGSYGLTSTPISLSAPITNRVYYLAVKP